MNTDRMKVLWEGGLVEGKTGKLTRECFPFDSKIPADGDCSHEIKRRLLLGRKVMTKLDSIFKSREITLPTKVFLVFPFGFFISIFFLKLSI